MSQNSWRNIASKLAGKNFDEHLRAYRENAGALRGIAWEPTAEERGETNAARFLEKKGLADFNALYEWSVADRAGFWEAAAAELGIRFRERCEETLDLSEGIEKAQWFKGSVLNIAESCFKADPDALAIRYRDFGGQLKELSYAKLEALANRVANSLVHAGFGPGDAIAVNMPMTVEAVAIYLGIVKMGGVVVSIADSFAPDEIRTRLRIAGALAIFTQDVAPRAGKELPLYQKVVDAEACRAVVIRVGKSSPRLRDGDNDWDSFLCEDEVFDAVACAPESPINILFSSGTTGDPKAIAWNHITPLKCATDGYFHHDIRVGDVVAWPTNLGWMMGPWLIFAALINKATIALCYEAPLGKEFGEFVERAGVTMLGLVPSLVKQWRSTACMEGLDWKSIRCFSSTGECSNSEDYLYLMYLADYRPVIEYCGGTEIGGGFITGSLCLPAVPGAFSTPALGSAFVILDEHDSPTDNGELFLIPPSVGLSTSLLNRDHHEVYYSGTPRGPKGELLRRHGDQFERFGNFYRGHGRVDDTMNLGGIKVSSAEIERVLNKTPGVKETAAIAVAPSGGGPSELVVFTVLNEKVPADALRTDFQKRIKSELNPLFKIHDLKIVDLLPRTASNKVMRRVLRKQYP
ncbi:MAG: AMP-binding protein [Bdellovibrionales bacterium]|nr:AMP-binding protein [Bdellovibrionales bacterium]